MLCCAVPPAMPDLLKTSMRSTCAASATCSQGVGSSRECEMTRTLFLSDLQIPM